MSADPAANLALILRESGLSQAQVAERIQQRGYSINRSTINRWANPGKVGVLKTDPILLQQTLVICGEAIGTKLAIDDLYSGAEDLERKIRFAREKSYLFGNIVSLCVGDFTARRMSGHLCGYYKAFMMSLFDANRLRMSLLHVQNDDDVSFRCDLHVLRNNQLTEGSTTIEGDDAEILLSGRMLFLGGVCHFMLESHSEPSMAAIIAARVPNVAPPIEMLDGLLTIFGSPSGASVVSARYLLVRTSEQTFKDLRTKRLFGELPADHADAPWVMKRLTRDFGGPHLIAV